jgi:two-component system KDP operon response regulator KdpE
MSNSARILIVEEGVKLRRNIWATLAAHGYESYAVPGSKEALKLIRSEGFDLVVLDLDLADKGGLEVCRIARTNFNTIVIVLTVRYTDKDKVRAFDAGADDYMAKPFLVSELMVRIRAHLRRHALTKQSHENLLVFDDYAVDFSRKIVIRGGERVVLSTKECDLLRFLVSNPGKALSHRTLLQAVWGTQWAHKTNLLQAVVAHLRKKIEPEPAAPQYIETIPWFGYRFHRACDR